MERIIDDVARILGTDMSRRKAFGLIGGVFTTAFFAMLGAEPVQAKACTPACGPGLCCNTLNPAKSECCTKGSCMCQNGKCSPSSGGRCPASCTVCA